MNSSERLSPWTVSAGLHGVVVLAAALTFAWGQRPRQLIDFEVIQYPETAAPTLNVDKPIERPAEAEQKRKVFGVSRRAIEDSAGTEVKAGNTVATEPDNKILQDDDASALPIPTDEYLVSSMPVLQSEVRLPYPAEAKAKGIEGPVVMDVLIDSEGKVREAKLVSGPGGGLNEAALEAIRNFRFKPAQASGQAVAVRIRYTYRFVLER